MLDGRREGRDRAWFAANPHSPHTEQSASEVEPLNVTTGFVEKSQFLTEDTKRPTVGNEAMECQRQDMLILVERHKATLNKALVRDQTVGWLRS